MNHNKLLASLALVFMLALLSVGLTAAAPNAIGNWCATDPVGNSACSLPISNTPSWVNPGYRWHVFYDTQGDTMCVRTRASSSDSWSNWTACQFVGDNPPWEDCGDNNPGNGNCRNDHWLCSTSTNYTPESSGRQFEFTERAGSGVCTGSQNDTSNAQSFSTGPNTLTLRSIQASPMAATALPLAGVGVAAVSLASAAVIWRRRR
jgi:hypothetical protein